LDRAGANRQDRAGFVDRLPGLLPGLVPSWGIAAGRHATVPGADPRVFARIPIYSALGDRNRILEVISAAQPLVTLAQQSDVTTITLPGGDTALAVQRIVKSLSGQVVVIQENTDSLWRSDAA